MRRLGAGAGAALIGIAIASCGGNEISLAELPARLIDIECGASVTCGTYPDEATCRAVIDPSLDQLQAEGKAGRVKVDAERAASCLDRIASALGSCRLSDRLISAPPPSCEQVFVGTVPAGGLCLHGEECVSQHCDV